MENGSGHIGLALSGGGFRATLFHLGVVRYFYDSGLLNRIRLITSVSGGSILAAHLALNWVRYTGDQKAFAEAAAEIIEFTRKDIRGRIIRRWACGTLLVLPRLLNGMTFASLLQREYAQLYRGATLKDLSGSDAHPKFSILSTSLTTGGLCAFTSEGFTFFDRNDQERTIRNASLRLSLAVAASSAFPPLFSPIPVTRELLNADSRDFDKVQYLTDGGVFDNLGLYELSRLANQKADTSRPDLVISDAGGNFDWAIGDDFRGFIPRNVRATEILMDRVSKLVPSVLIHGGMPPCHIYIGRELTNSEAPHSQPPEVQRGVRNIRTDLDSFSLLEIEALITQGYEEARFSLGSSGVGLPLRGHFKLWDFGQAEASVVRRIVIQNAQQRDLRFFAMKDPVSWLLLLLVLVWVIPIAAIPLALYMRARVETETKAEEFDTLIETIGIVNGRVTDESGNGISGVAVGAFVGESSVVVETSASGDFVLKLDAALEEEIARGIVVKDVPKIKTISVRLEKDGYVSRTFIWMLGSVPAKIVLQKKQ